MVLNPSNSSNLEQLALNQIAGVEWVNWSCIKEVVTVYLQTVDWYRVLEIGWLIWSYCSMRTHLSAMDMMIWTSWYEWSVTLRLIQWLSWLLYSVFVYPVLRTLAYLNHNNFVATASKYGFDNYMVNVKYAIWQNFGKSLLWVCLYVGCVLLFLLIFIIYQWF